MYRYDPSTKQLFLPFSIGGTQIREVTYLVNNICNNWAAAVRWAETVK